MSFTQALALIRQSQQLVDQSAAVQSAGQSEVVAPLDATELSLIGGGGAHGGNTL